MSLAYSAFLVSLCSSRSVCPAAVVMAAVSCLLRSSHGFSEALVLVPGIDAQFPPIHIRSMSRRIDLGVAVLPSGGKVREERGELNCGRLACGRRKSWFLPVFFFLHVL